MPSKNYTTLGTRIPVELAGQIREAATREGVTVSLWLARRARNNLRRTGRLVTAGYQTTTIEANQ